MKSISFQEITAIFARHPCHLCHFRLEWAPDSTLIHIHGMDGIDVYGILPSIGNGA